MSIVFSSRERRQCTLVNANNRSVVTYITGGWFDGVCSAAGFLQSILTPPDLAAIIDSTLSEHVQREPTLFYACAACIECSTGNFVSYASELRCSRLSACASRIAARNDMNSCEQSLYKCNRCRVTATDNASARMVDPTNCNEVVLPSGDVTQEGRLRQRRQTPRPLVLHIVEKARESGQSHGQVQVAGAYLVNAYFGATISSTY